MKWRSQKQNSDVLVTSTLGTIPPLPTCFLPSFTPCQMWAYHVSFLAAASDCSHFLSQSSPPFHWPVSTLAQVLLTALQFPDASLFSSCGGAYPSKILSFSSAILPLATAVFLWSYIHFPHVWHGDKNLYREQDERAITSVLEVGLGLVHLPVKEICVLKRV